MRLPEREIREIRVISRISRIREIREIRVITCNRIIRGKVILVDQLTSSWASEERGLPKRPE